MFVLSCFSNVASMACSVDDFKESNSSNRYEIVKKSKGAEVKDKLTGLIWQRCVVGMKWNGKDCIASPDLMNWEKAQEMGKSNPKKWMLPNHSQLISLVNRHCFKPAINRYWFPSSPSGWTWSSHPVSSYEKYAWVVGFSYGYYYAINKEVPAVVRLVRESD